MRLSDWFDQTVPGMASKAERITAVVPPYIKIPGLYEQIFPSAQISYVSLIRRPNAYCPSLNARGTVYHEVPFLNLHIELVKEYWKHDWRPWSFLEAEFATLRQSGFEFAKGQDELYTDVIKTAGSQFVDIVAMNAEAGRSDGIVVYGRGHWTMNAAAVAADRLHIPLFVIERGILPNSYIVDHVVPFTAPRSKFRSAWQSFREFDYQVTTPIRGLSESSLRLYERLLEGSLPQVAPTRTSNIIVGQCSFDFNLLYAPFKTPADFVNYVLDRHRFPQADLVHVSYRPHPLSPEVYSSGTISTDFGFITVDTGDVWRSLNSLTTLYTWNSTLGLEGFLVFNCRAVILDSSCHYCWIERCSEADKQKYIDFLNAYSVLQ